MVGDTATGLVPTGVQAEAMTAATIIAIGLRNQSNFPTYSVPIVLPALGGFTNMVDSTASPAASAAMVTVSPSMSN